VIEKAFLPMGRFMCLLAQGFRQTVFQGLHPIAQEDIASAINKEVQMIWHHYIAANPNIMFLGLLTKSEEGLMDNFICQERLSLVGIAGDEVDREFWEYLIEAREAGWVHAWALT
jgi:hypothetical protein